MTYSIVGRDPATGEIGGAVQTRWFAAGAGVLWVEPGVGAVATQSFTLLAHGANGLALLRDGISPQAALDRILASDAGREVRQVGVLSVDGSAAAFTGARCVPAAGHVASVNSSCQANMMERDTVWPAMLDAFESASGDLASRLVAALRAAEAEGGDVRGRQSAALVVAPGGAGRPAWERRFDLRVDDARDPLGELDRLLRVARGYEAFEAAMALAESGAIDEALVRCEEARSHAPDDDQVAVWYAVCLAAGGRTADARALYRTALTAERRAGEHLRRFVAAGDADWAAAAIQELTE